MAKNQVVIQSFIPNRFTVNFRDEKGNVVMVGNQPKTVTVPSKFDSPKNVLVLSKTDFEAVKQDLGPYVDMGQRGGVTILDDIPSGYWDPAQRVAAAESAKQFAEGALAGANVKIGERQAEIDRLKDILTRTYGWKGE